MKNGKKLLLFEWNFSSCCLDSVSFWINISLEMNTRFQTILQLFQFRALIFYIHGQIPILTFFVVFSNSQTGCTALQFVSYFWSTGIVWLIRVLRSVRDFPRKIVLLSIILRLCKYSIQLKTMSWMVKLVPFHWTVRDQLR